jgi:hypothetical protein
MRIGHSFSAGAGVFRSRTTRLRRRGRVGGLVRVPPLGVFLLEEVAGLGDAPNAIP